MSQEQRAARPRTELKGPATWKADVLVAVEPDHLSFLDSHWIQSLRETLPRPRPPSLLTSNRPRSLHSWLITLSRRLSPSSVGFQRPRLAYEGSSYLSCFTAGGVDSASWIWASFYDPSTKDLSPDSIAFYTRPLVQHVGFLLLRSLSSPRGSG